MMRRASSSRRLQQQLPFLMCRRRADPHMIVPLRHQHRSLTAAAAAAATASQHDSHHRSSSSLSARAAAAAGAAAVAASLLLGSSSLASASCDAPAPAPAAEGTGGGSTNAKGKNNAPDAGGPVLPMKEVMRLISAGLQDFRAQRFGASYNSTTPNSGSSGSTNEPLAPPPPPLSASSSYPKVAVLAKGRGADEPYTIEVPLPPSSRIGALIGGGVGTEARVLAACLSALQRAGYSLTFHTGLTSLGSTSLSFVLDNGGKGSVALASSSPSSSGGNGAKASLVLYKKEGFTKGDIDVVVESYKAAWGGEGGAASGAGGGGAGIVMNFAELLEALRTGGFGTLGPDAAKDIFGPLLDPPSSSSSSSFSSSAIQRLPGVGGGGGSSSSSGSVLAPRGGSGVSTGGRSGGGNGFAAGNDPVSRLRKLGAEVYERGEGEEGLDWSCLAGYDAIREEVEDTVVMALQHADAYDAVAKHTRARYESNRPRAVLFEGPPGTGKTLTARIIASRTDVPLVFVPTERILSKWYGDSEKNLAKVLEACQELGGAIVFIDEVDALATSRDSNMHEATRRILSVLLQSIEGFKTGGNRNVLICATNRKQDLDAALLSRFDVAVRFELPNRTARQAIFGRYAKHLTQGEVAQLADASEGYSCRDVKEVCENAERRWASKLIRDNSNGAKGKGKGGEGEEEQATTVTMSAPPLKAYLQAARARGVSTQPGRHLSV